MQRFRLIGSLLLTLLLGAIAWAEDLREQFGTRSAVAAQALQQGITLVQGHNLREALPHLDRAIEADPKLQLAVYWKALTYHDLGDLDAAFAAYEQVVEISKTDLATNVTVDACINAGLTYAKLEEEEKAARWFTRAVLLNPRDDFDLHWKAYRNTAISMHVTGHHLSAALATISAYRANPEKVELQMVFDFLDKVGDNDEYGQVLYFGEETSEIAPRKIKTALTPRESDRPLKGKISELIIAPRDNCIVALIDNEPDLVVIDAANGQRVRELAMPGAASALQVVGEKLYAMIGLTNELIRINLKDGAIEKRWKTDIVSRGLAVFPSQQIAMFAAGGKLHRLDLETGKRTETDFSSHRVVGDPYREFCFSYFVDASRRQPNSGHVIINGRPVFFHRTTNFDWSQTALFHFAISAKEASLAAVRLNAASNGRVLHVSPDGKFVAVVGGGGWRPKQGSSRGYGVAVFPTASFKKPQGYFAVGAYPKGVAINPVTHQVVVVNDKVASVQHLSGQGEAWETPIKEGGPAAWSADGKYLYLASSEGLKIWENELTAAESAIGKSWAEELHTPERNDPTKRKGLQTVAEALPVLKEFVVKSERKDVAAALQAASKRGSTTQPPDWIRYRPYQQDAKLSGLFAQLIGKASGPDAGIRIYRLKKAKQGHPDHPGIDLLLGLNYFFSQRHDEAAKHMLAALRTDAGRTNISIQALRGLARIRAKAEDESGAAFCMAHALMLDLANPDFLSEAESSFKAAGVLREAQALLNVGRASSTTGMDSEPMGKLPPLLKPQPDRKKKSADQLFEQVAPSVVVVKAGANTGTGVCIAAKGYILTNDHVIATRPGSIELTAYVWRDGKLSRLDNVDGTVVYRSAKHDLAVVKASSAPSTLKPLPFALVAPRVGVKVFALGNPGLGRQTLDQTFSDGIISSAERSLEGISFLQHTAAVNAGNSGGPVLNEYGEVVGIVTLKATLENTSFAIPAKRIRGLLNPEEE